MTRVAASHPVEDALEHLSDRARERLLALGRRVEHGRDAAILREGLTTPFLGVVERGRVALQVRIPELGQPLTIATIEPGELLGWTAVVAPYRATADAVATEPTRILAFDAPALRTLIANDVELASELLPLILETVSHRLTASWTQLLDLFGALERTPW